LKFGTDTLRATILEKALATQKFKMAAIAIKCLYQFKQWSKHNIWYKNSKELVIGKRCLSLKYSRWSPSVYELFQLFKWWCKHKSRQTYSSRNTFLEKGMCHSNQNGHHLEL